MMRLRSQLGGGRGTEGEASCILPRVEVAINRDVGTRLAFRDGDG